ncbi:MAG: glucose-6-phosphate dehydrogenase [Planctomycetota bacterium]|nr:glucose-6-phosphate dehydrogenase [Planctomycetota bacterium]MDA1214391.1 glucose-6-phosphate dehydrogenase [Planctomycetota bacterium]
MSISVNKQTAHSFHAQSPGDGLEITDASILIFGASGDLTSRKLIPALYLLWKEGYLADNIPIIGVARRPKTDEEFRNEFKDDVRHLSRSGPVSDEQWEAFSRRMFYQRLDISDVDSYAELKRTTEQREQEAGLTGNRLVYLATTPELFLPAVEGIHKAGMVPSRDAKNWLRVVFEKPFGHDLASAQELDQQLTRMLREEQIYRIDHYLGKETVQNILLFRFGNSIFEPLLNRNHVDHVQITVAESQGMEHGRGGYYDRSGAMRDVMQNHLLQLLCLVAMEPPALFRAKDIRDEKLKVLEALAPGQPGSIGEWAVSGQYAAGEVDGTAAIAYRDEERIPKDSRRETFVAMEVGIDNWRWAGVPFYLRTGKRLPQRVTEIAVQFKLPPLNLFTTVECEGDICDLVGAQPNTLIFRIQPRESISLSFSTKRPGMQYQIHPVRMDFAYESTFQKDLPEAYERLLLDVLRGDSTLFTRSDELEAAWKFVTPVLEYWERNKIEPQAYGAGTWGPKRADELLTHHGRKWRVPQDERKKGE